MEVLAVVGSDGERLLHEAVRLVAVAIGSAVRVLVVGCLGGIAAGILVEAARATSLALHLTVGQETSRDTAGAPGLAVSPSAHARLALIPDKHRARLDRLPLLLGQTPLHSREKADATCLEENDGVRGRANVAVVSLHCAQAVSRICFRRRRRCMLFSQDHREIGGRFLGEVNEAAYGRSRGDCCRKDRVVDGARYSVEGLMG